MLADISLQGNTWEPKYGDKPPFQATYQIRLRQPEPGTYYKVIYRDSARIAFEAPGLARVIEGVSGQEVPQLLDLLEPGDIWEIAAQGHGKRVWRKTTFPPFAATIAIYAQQNIPFFPEDTLQVNTPYRLVKWEVHYRLWEDRITRREVLEARAPTRQVAATGGHGHMILNASTRGKGVRVMLDSSAQKNFISPETVR
jgi:hypothetical protein